MLLIIIKTYLFFFLLLTPLLLGQIVIDNLTQKESLILGVINFVLIKNIHYMALTYFLVKFVSFLTGEELEIMPRRKKTI
ncbi:Glycerophosphoryl diester phosphodiesterase [Streptococcus oralis]|uniref:Glycerophosphoryl diester phosphodiesterase n=1 Tax=Streptococcus oralis TaxID=1303 RepID=A0A139PQS1_STROR|nr:Glycerophosphoryl diester phosphodiesterase [Streptococcus oralis]